MRDDNRGQVQGDGALGDVFSPDVFRLLEEEADYKYHNTSAGKFLGSCVSGLFGTTWLNSLLVPNLMMAYAPLGLVHA